MSALVRMFVSVPVTSVRSVVSGAPLARIENESCEVAFDYCLDVAAAKPHDRDDVGFEFVFGPFAHIARQHRRNAAALQVGSDARLATSPLRRGQLFACCNGFVFYRIDRVMVAMAEVVVDATVSCRNCNFHDSIKYLRWLFFAFRLAPA